MGNQGAHNLCLVALGFGERTGLPLSRFDALWSCVTFSEQKSSGGVNWEQRRRELILGVADSVNDHGSAHVSPSECIHVDESMCHPPPPPPPPPLPPAPAARREGEGVGKVSSG